MTTGEDNRAPSTTMHAMPRTIPAALSLLLLSLVACEKSPPQPSATPEPATSKAVVVATITATPSAAAPTPSEPAAAPSASAAPRASTSAAPKASAAASGSAAPKAKTPASTTMSDKDYDLVVATPGCAVGEECSLSLTLSTKGGFHVNKEYPYKFTAAPSGAITYTAKAAPNVFSKASGDFTEQGETQAVMTVRYRAAEAGAQTLAGTYKMSVCSADQCRIVDPKVALAVTVR